MNEKNERIKFIPIHQHMHVEHVEAAFMISSMIHEMPMISSKRATNKFFKKLLDNYEKNHFVSVESNKDFIFVASQELEKGDWQASYEQLLQVSLLKQESPALRETILTKLKEASLRCYLLNHHHCF